IKSIRNIRTQMNVPPSKKAAVIFVTDKANFNLLTNCTPYIKRLGYASNVLMQESRDGISDDAASSVIDGAEIFIPLEELIDFEKELQRLEKELANIESELARVKGKLSNQGFIAKAPAKLVEEENAKLEKYDSMYKSTKNRIDSLKSKMN
ncbi:MAG: valine--tRNA ligase, partial [Clostridia bacterium]|nr:valine--tRNA ligase [Clostridia bacterium]